MNLTSLPSLGYVVVSMVLQTTIRNQSLGGGSPNFISSRPHKTWIYPWDCHLWGGTIERVFEEGREVDTCFLDVAGLRPPDSGTAVHAAAKYTVWRLGLNSSSSDPQYVTVLSHHTTLTKNQWRSLLPNGGILRGENQQSPSSHYFFYLEKHTAQTEMQGLGDTLQQFSFLPKLLK